MYLGFARISPAPLPTSCSKSLLSLCWARVILLIGLLAFAHYPHYSFTYNQGKFLKKYKSGHVTLHKFIHWLCIAWKIKFKPTSVAYKILYAWAALHLLPSSWTIMLQLHWLLLLFFFWCLNTLSSSVLQAGLCTLPWTESLCLSHPARFIFWNLIPSVMVFGGGTFG